MGRFFVAGLVNVETTVAIDSFPLDYFPVCYPFHGLYTSVSGVGWNIAKALTTLGNSVDFATLIGRDPNGQLARQKFANSGIHEALVLEMLDATAQSVILYDPNGRRQIHVDLKDIQRKTYPAHLVEGAVRHCDLAVICIINFARPLLAVAREAGKPIATDVHALSDLEDDYNTEFMRHATILFLSDESLPDRPEEVAKHLLDRYEISIIVIGLGVKGAFLAVRADDFIGCYPAVYTRPVLNTIGAGDALFSAFLDRYTRWGDPYTALEAALVFASYKIGEKGAAEGYLTSDELDGWDAKTKN